MLPTQKQYAQQTQNTQRKCALPGLWEKEKRFDFTFKSIRKRLFPLRIWHVSWKVKLSEWRWRWISFCVKKNAVKNQVNPVRYNININKLKIYYRGREKGGFRKNSKAEEKENRRELEICSVSPKHRHTGGGIYYLLLNFFCFIYCCCWSWNHLRNYQLNAMVSGLLNCWLEDHDYDHETFLILVSVLKISNNFLGFFFLVIWSIFFIPFELHEAVVFAFMFLGFSFSF